MSPKNALLTVGLTALGFFGVSATRFAYSDDQGAPPGPPSAPAPAPPSTAPAAASADRVLLLYSGQILRGAFADDGADYRLSQNGGEIRVRKDRVEAAFDSLTALYEYKLAQVPDRDPDEHFKLAKWCLEQKLNAEAKEQLKAVVRLSPKARQAQAMLAAIEGSEVRLAQAKSAVVDSEVMQSRAEVTVTPRPRAGGRPGELDAAVIRKAQHELGVSGLPVIFDLPPALAVKRADEFAAAVLPVLQTSCVKCHNERYAGAFQLIEFKTKRDRTPDALRANLDATLQFVNKDNPSKSELLATVLLPHGGGPNPRPVFRGSNDQRFAILAAWVNRLKEPTPSASAGRARLRTGEPNAVAGGPTFGADRGNGPGPLSFTPTPESFGSNDRPWEKAATVPPSRYVPGKGMAVEKGEPSPDEFPVPFAAGGPPPAAGAGAKAPAAKAKRPPAAPKVDRKAPAADEGSPLPGADPEVDAASLPESETEPEPEPAPVAKPKAAKPKAPVKIDGSLLEKFLAKPAAPR